MADKKDKKNRKKKGTKKKHVARRAPAKPADPVEPVEPEVEKTVDETEAPETPEAPEETSEETTEEPHGDEKEDEPSEEPEENVADKLAEAQAKAEADRRARKDEVKGDRTAKSKRAERKRKQAAELRAQADEIEASLGKPVMGPNRDLPEGEDEYWFGTLPSHPSQNITIGSMSFPRVTQRVTDTRGLRTERSSHLGMVGVIDDERADHIQKTIRHLVMRTGHPPTKVDLRKKKRIRGDVDMGNIVFFMSINEAADRYGPNWREKLPENFSETDNG